MMGNWRVVVSTLASVVKRADDGVGGKGRVDQQGQKQDHAPQPHPAPVPAAVTPDRQHERNVAQPGETVNSRPLPLDSHS